jgi:hypothetical protein
MFFGIITGLIGCLNIVLGNIIINIKIKIDKRASVLKVFLITLSAVCISSLVGTAIFFSH